MMVEFAESEPQLQGEPAEAEEPGAYQVSTGHHGWAKGEWGKHSVCVCVCVRVRACMYVCVWAHACAHAQAQHS